MLVIISAGLRGAFVGGGGRPAMFGGIADNPHGFCHLPSPEGAVELTLENIEIKKPANTKKKISLK